MLIAKKKEKVTSYVFVLIQFVIAISEWLKLAPPIK